MKVEATPPSANLINWQVKGMSCTNCALTLEKYLQEKGMSAVKVNFMGGELGFENRIGLSPDALKKGIRDLGYQVVEEETSVHKTWGLQNHFQRFLFCAVFALPLMTHMVPGLHWHWLMNPWVQIGLTLPVLWVGLRFFGRSAWKSLRKGVPNMNVLVTVGAVAAFVYSLYGTLTGQAEKYLFYETTATIFTLVFLGNWLEDRSVEATQKTLRQLIKSQKTMANMLAYDDQHQEHVFPVESTALKVGDLILVRQGEVVPMDCKILSGTAAVDESIVTGESLPIEKSTKDMLIGGSVLVQGNIKAYVLSVGKDAVLGHILEMVKNAQTEKPPIQKLADKISAVFVPVVLGIAVLTFLGNYFWTPAGTTESLMRSIAVLVIACPCAMGLATPAAIAVGLGRAAKNGVFFKDTSSLEKFKFIQQVVFDKTGTLTTGAFDIAGFELTPAGQAWGVDRFQQVVGSLEKFSNHPLAKTMAKAWKPAVEVVWLEKKETRGMGMEGVTKEGERILVGSWKITDKLNTPKGHNLYVMCNGEWMGWIDLVDQIRPEAKSLMGQLHQQGIRTILLSGDSFHKCEALAKDLGMTAFYAEQSPEEKLQKIGDWCAQVPTAMVGDGINDAPALAKATVGVSLSEASQLALQSADVVLMNNGLKNLGLGLGLGKHTYRTIQENLFWALLYNVIAIPIAAFGGLTPTVGALVMGLSDVVLALNSIRLFYKKVV
ncbi:MAG: cadmium-translocating P-type ATPase [Sphingobacteriia bacterium]|nr:MAG: cadmium-translocating P-type ATPase [Sphingobacteriia bacterium]